MSVKQVAAVIRTAALIKIQNGEPRIRNGRLERPVRVDMGAYELPAPRGSYFLVR